MDNEVYFNNIKNYYESLRFFQISNNTLIFHDQKTYQLPLSNVVLANINSNLFLLKPRDIYRVLCMLELLPRDQISDNDKSFIEQYVNKYLEMEAKKLSNQEIDENEVNCLGIPIYLSDDPKYESTKCSSIIHELLNKDLNNKASGKSNSPVLVRTNPNYKGFEEDTSNFEDITKAGFTTILLISGGVISTLLYIIYFIIK